jgi:hypothetical protein
MGQNTRSVQYWFHVKQAFDISLKHTDPSKTLVSRETGKLETYRAKVGTPTIGSKRKSTKAFEPI